MKHEDFIIIRSTIIFLAERMRTPTISLKLKAVLSNCHGLIVEYFQENTELPECSLTSTVAANPEDFKPTPQVYHTHGPDGREIP